MDITETLAPDSQQLDAFELTDNPRTFVIAGVSKGAPDQPVNIALVDFPRAWRPGKSMRRVLASCWGTDASKYVGRSVRLYCDPNVMFGKDRVGGTRIEALSHIDGPKSVPLLVSRGKSAMFTVQPLTTEPPAPTVTPAQVAACTSPDELRAMWGNADADTQALILARKTALEGGQS
jgi:hypothetical protein